MLLHNCKQNSAVPFFITLFAWWMRHQISHTSAPVLPYIYCIKKYIKAFSELCSDFTIRDAILKCNKISILECAYVLFGYISNIYAKSQPDRASRFYVIENTDGHNLLIQLLWQRVCNETHSCLENGWWKRYCRNDVLEKIEPNQYPNAYTSKTID